jgi:hypothetical protein
MRVGWSLVAVCLVGCPPKDPVETGGDADTDADVDSEVETDEPMICGDIPPDLCAENVACRTIKGFRVVEDPTDAAGHCVDKDALPSRIGCISKDVDCEGQVKWARPPGAPDSTCFLVVGTCVPRDYVGCVNAMEVDNECATN